jgi:hypothetical protein
MEYQSLLIISVVAAIVHVAEEYLFNWIEWANELISGITVRQFMLVNFLFIVLCIGAAILSSKFIVFSSSIFSLLLINSLAHIAPTIKQVKYSPGLVSASLLFMPIGIVGYTDLLGNNIITIKEFVASLLIGVLWMCVPFIYQAIRITNERKA